MSRHHAFALPFPAVGALNPTRTRRQRAEVGPPSNGSGPGASNAQPRSSTQQRVAPRQMGILYPSKSSGHVGVLSPELTQSYRYDRVHHRATYKLQSFVFGPQATVSLHVQPHQVRFVRGAT